MNQNISSASCFGTGFLSAKFVLVVGDSLLDHYEIGDVKRISPEAPVPVFQTRVHRTVAGGAANVAMNCASLGARTVLVSVVGNDSQAQDLHRTLAEGGVDFRKVVDDGRPTTVKTRIVANNQQLVRIDRERSTFVDQAIEEKLLSLVDSLLPNACVLLVSDYAKGVLTDKFLAKMLRCARDLGVPSIVDPKRRDFSAYREASLIKPNLSELEAASGIDCSSFEGIERSISALEGFVEAKILVTRSERGMSLFSNGRPVFHVPAQAKEVYDVSGAGDTVLATLGVSLAGGCTYEEAVLNANAAASVVVTKAGTAVIQVEELRQALDSDTVRTVQAPTSVVSWDELYKLCEVWRLEGKTIGFTNGCFDLIHPGHVEIVRKAASLCDKLIVALNSDASISKLKGPSRPVQIEADRAEVMSALKGVAAVVIFDEPTPLELIKYLHPDLIVKGGDYVESSVVGADVVKSTGGRVVIVPLVKGRSTSALIKRANS